MPYPPPLAAALTDDTPVHERPPYGRPRRWRFAVILVIAVAVLVVLVALVRRLRRAWRIPVAPEVIMFPMPDEPYAGAVYRVEFFDDTHRQLADRRLSVALADPYGPLADRALTRLAVELQAEVERRDAQRCFRPRIDLYDAADRLVRSWSASSW